MPDLLDAVTRRARVPQGRECARAGVLAVVLAVCVAGAWEWAARRGWIDPFFVSRPSSILLQLLDWRHGGTTRGPLAVHVGVTLLEAVGGGIAGLFAARLAGAVFVGPTLHGRIFRGMLALLSPAPRVALGAALTLGLGLGMAPKILLAAVLAFFPAAADALTGRSVWVAARRACALALLGAVLGECFGARAGVGFLLMNALRQFNASGVYAAILLLVVLAVALDAMCRLLGAWRLRTPDAR